MIAKARETGLYDSLEVGGAVAFLASPAARSADLIVAADVFAYIGDLGPIFEAVARALANGGWLAFSVETCEGEGYCLDPAMRFIRTPTCGRRRIGPGCGDVSSRTSRYAGKRVSTHPGCLAFMR